MIAVLAKLLVESLIRDGARSSGDDGGSGRAAIVAVGAALAETVSVAEAPYCATHICLEALAAVHFHLYPYLGLLAGGKMKVERCDPSAHLGRGGLKKKMSCFACVLVIETP